MAAPRGEETLTARCAGCPGSLLKTADRDRDHGVDLEGIAALFVAVMVLLTLGALATRTAKVWLATSGAMFATAGLVLFAIVELSLMHAVPGLTRCLEVGPRESRASRGVSGRGKREGKPYGQLIAVAIVLTTLIGALVAFAQASALRTHDESDARAENLGALALESSAVDRGQAEVQINRFNLLYTEQV